MKALKIKLYQPFACYRKPNSFGVVESYLLPPPSTIKGWFHYVLEAKEELPIAVSIHGSIGGITYELQRFIKFDKTGRDEANRPFLEGFRKTLVHSPIYVELLYDVNLTIYISTKNELLKKFSENLLLRDFPSIGRKEDLAVLLEEPKEVELKPYVPSFLEGLETKEWSYFTRETAKKLGISGTYYRLGVSYSSYLKEKLGWRFFKKKDFLLALSGELIRETADNLYIDPTEERVLEMIKLERFENV
ncbi:type I-B CRISPR-associated protein Cas5b [Thermovibrio sp.]